MASDEQFSLCWNNFHANMSAGFHGLLSRGDLVDVTLAAEGRLLQAHKLVLSVCSPYFQEMFKMNPTQHPIVFLKDVSHSALRDLLQFMYQGEVNVKQEELASFISTAEQLQVKGLTGNQNEESSTPSKPKPTSRPGPRSSQQRQSVMTKLETELDSKPSSTPVAVKRPNRPSIASNNSSSSQSGPAKRKCVDPLEAGPSGSAKEEFVTIPDEDENNAVAPKMEPEFVNESMWDEDEGDTNNDETNFGEDDSNMEMTGFDGSTTGDGNITGGEGGAVGDAQETGKVAKRIRTKGGKFVSNESDGTVDRCENKGKSSKQKERDESSFEKILEVLDQCENTDSNFTTEGNTGRPDNSLEIVTLSEDSDSPVERNESDSENLAIVDLCESPDLTIECGKSGSEEKISNDAHPFSTSEENGACSRNYSAIVDLSESLNSECSANMDVTKGAQEIIMEEDNHKQLISIDNNRNESIISEGNTPHPDQIHLESFITDTTGFVENTPHENDLLIQSSNTVENIKTSSIMRQNNTLFENVSINVESNKNSAEEFSEILDFETQFINNNNSHTSIKRPLDDHYESNDTIDKAQFIKGTKTIEGAKRSRIEDPASDYETEAQSLSRFSDEIDCRRPYTKNIKLYWYYPAKSRKPIFPTKIKHLEDGSVRRLLGHQLKYHIKTLIASQGRRTRPDTKDIATNTSFDALTVQQQHETTSGGKAINESASQTNNKRQGIQHTVSMSPKEADPPQDGPALQQKNLQKTTQEPPIPGTSQGMPSVPIVRFETTKFFGVPCMYFPFGIRDVYRDMYNKLIREQPTNATPKLESQKNPDGSYSYWWCNPSSGLHASNMFTAQNSFLESDRTKAFDSSQFGARENAHNSSSESEFESSDSESRSQSPVHVAAPINIHQSRNLKYKDYRSSIFLVRDNVKGLRIRRRRLSFDILLPEIAADSDLNVPVASSVLPIIQRRHLEVEQQQLQVGPGIIERRINQQQVNIELQPVFERRLLNAEQPQERVDQQPMIVGRPPVNIEDQPLHIAPQLVLPRQQPNGGQIPVNVNNRDIFFERPPLNINQHPMIIDHRNMIIQRRQANIEPQQPVNINQQGMILERQPLNNGQQPINVDRQQQYVEQPANIDQRIVIERRQLNVGQQPVNINNRDMIIDRRPANPEQYLANINPAPIIERNQLNVEHQPLHIEPQLVFPRQQQNEEQMPVNVNNREIILERPALNMNQQLINIDHRNMIIQRRQANIEQQPVNINQQGMILERQPLNNGQQPVNVDRQRQHVEQPANIDQQPVIERRQLNVGPQPVNINNRDMIIDRRAANAEQYPANNNPAPMNERRQLNVEQQPANIEPAPMIERRHPNVERQGANAVVRQPLNPEQRPINDINNDQRLMVVQRVPLNFQLRPIDPRPLIIERRPVNDQQNPLNNDQQPLIIERRPVNFGFRLINDAHRPMEIEQVVNFEERVINVEPGQINAEERPMNVPRRPLDQNHPQPRQRNSPEREINVRPNSPRNADHAHRQLDSPPIQENIAANGRPRPVNSPPRAPNVQARGSPPVVAHIRFQPLGSPPQRGNQNDDNINIQIRPAMPQRGSPDWVAINRAWPLPSPDSTM